MLGFAFAAFVCVFLGIEYADGTLRNKLIAGHSRDSVFLSFFFVSVFGCVCIMAVALIGGLVGLCWFDGFGFGWKIYALTVIVLLCSTLLFAAVFTVISMLIPNIAVSTMVSLALWFALLFAGSEILNMLSRPEMVCDYAWVNGELTASAPYPNPYYVGGTKRKALEVITHILPVCPAIKMAGYSPDGFVADMIGSAGMTAVILFGGCKMFRRKDLK